MLVFRNCDNIVCHCLFLAIQLYGNFKLYCFYFFPKSAFPNYGCGLSKDAAYTWTFTVLVAFSHTFLIMKYYLLQGELCCLQSPYNKLTIF